MSQTMLLGELSQSFVSLGTLRRMSLVATKMAVVRKAITDIRNIEDMLLVTGDDEKNLKQAMIDTAMLSKIAGRNTAEAVGLLRQMIPDVEAYLAEVERNGSG